jgi:hypothetical protein
MQTKQDPVLLMVLKIMQHAKLSLSDHISYLRVLVSRKDMQGTVLLRAEGAFHAYY